MDRNIGPPRANAKLIYGFLTPVNVQLNWVGGSDNRGLIIIVQWVGIATSPLAFLVGAFIVNRKRDRLYRTMDKLHGECELQKEIAMSGGRTNNDTRHPKFDNVDSVMATPAAVKVSVLHAHFNTSPV